MIKGLLLVFVMLFSISNLHSQVYNFSYFQDPYYEFNDGTEIDFYQVCFGNQHPVPIGFEFPIFQYAKDTLFISKYSAAFAPEASSNIYAYFALFEAKTQCHSFLNTRFSYKTTGSPGQRIFKYQAKNMGFTATGASSDYFSYQLWLYEGAGTIEFRAGPNQIQDPTGHYHENFTGPIVGLLLMDEAFDIVLPGSLLLKNQPHAPYAVQNTDLLNVPFLSYQPASGQVYRFENQIVEIPETTDLFSAVTVSPNPSRNIIKVSGLASSQNDFSVYNMNGKRMIHSKNPTIEIDDLINGIYLLKIETKLGNKTLRFVKE